MSSRPSGTDLAVLFCVLLTTLVGLTLLLSPKPRVPDAEIGVLVLAHGGSQEWNKAVEDAVKDVRGEFKKEIAFGMADAQTIQPAIDRLEKLGVKKIVAVPLLLSSSSELFRQLEFVLGLRDEPDALFAILMKERNANDAHRASPNPTFILKQVRFSVPFILTKAVDYDPLVTSILAERIKGLGLAPRNLSIFLIAHGPVSEEDNKLWISNLRLYARGLARQFRGISIATHTVRDDAPGFIKEMAQETIQRSILEEKNKGRKVALIPFLLAPGQREKEIRRIFSECWCNIADKTLLPHPNISLWIEQQIRTGKKKLRSYN